jgi:hypothetical protein
VDRVVRDSVQCEPVCDKFPCYCAETGNLSCYFRTFIRGRRSNRLIWRGFVTTVDRTSRDLESWVAGNLFTVNRSQMPFAASCVLGMTHRGLWTRIRESPW